LNLALFTVASEIGLNYNASNILSVLENVCGMHWYSLTNLFREFDLIYDLDYLAR
jgi:hypothetical protein